MHPAPLMDSGLCATSVAVAVAAYLDLADVCRASMCCKAARQGFGSRARRAASLFGGGAPAHLRLRFWAKCLKVEETKQQICKSQDVSADEYYQSLLAKATRGQNCGRTGTAALSPTGVQGEILRDVCRTFPGLAFFRRRDGPGENMLSNVLRACAIAHPDVGYCQGMNFVAGALLLAHLSSHPDMTPHPEDDAAHDAHSDGSQSSNTSRDASPDPRTIDWWPDREHLRMEQDVFWMMAALLTKGRAGAEAHDELCLKELWLPGVPEMKLRVYQFDRLLERELPRLHAHFKTTQLQLEVLVSQWLLTLFAYSLPLPTLVRAWDALLMDGWKGVFRLGIARLRDVQEQLVGMEIEEMSKFLRGFRTAQSLHARCPPEQLLRACGSIKVTRSALRTLQQDFAVRLLREHLGGGQGEWLQRYSPLYPPPPDAAAAAAAAEVSSGVEAAVRGMLLDEPLLLRLKQEIEAVSGPVAGDVAVFQCKIAAAAIRQEEARQQAKVLAPTTTQLGIEVEELRERVSLLSHQMHALVLAPPCEDCALSAAAAPDDEGSPNPTAGVGARGPWGGGPSDAAAAAMPGRRSNLNLRGLAAMLPQPLRLLSGGGGGSPSPENGTGSSGSGGGGGGDGLRLCPRCMHERTDLSLYKNKLDEVCTALAQREARWLRHVQRYDAALAEVEDAEQLKMVLSSQMLQLVQDADERVEDTLREFAQQAQDVMSAPPTPPLPAPPAAAAAV